MALDGIIKSLGLFNWLAEDHFAQKGIISANAWISISLPRSQGLSKPVFMEADSDLKQALTDGRVVIVAGAGVSIAVAGLPNWRTAVGLAIDHIEHVGIASPSQTSILREDLENATTTDQLISCAASARSHLTGSSASSGEFAAWLRSTFDVDISSASDESLLRGLHALPSCLITTTNYDKLISRSKSGLDSISWRESPLLNLALNDSRRVVHLHGVWDDPDSVVFGTRDYELTSKDPAYQTFLQTLWIDRTLLFIGCSFDGMKDPDFVAMLDRMARTFPHATNRHFALVRSNSYTPDQAEEFLTKWRIQLIPFGERHEYLVPFLESLARSPDDLVPSPPRAFVGREPEIEEIVELVRDGRSVLMHGMGGIGKTSLLARALTDLRANHPGIRQLWLRRTAASAFELCREVGRLLEMPDVNVLIDHDLVDRLALGLAKVRDILLVIDDGDATVVRDFMQMCIPAGVAFVATSRTRFAGFDAYIEVGPLGDESADHLFTQLAGVTGQDGLVRQICSLLGNHPLAISLAAGRHAVESLPLHSILARLSEEKHRLDALRDSNGSETPNSSVRASLALSIDGLPADLFEMLAVLGRFYADTSISLLALALRLDQFDCEDRVGRLVSRSLAQRSPSGAVHLHQLIRDAINERAAEEAPMRQQMIESAVISLIHRLDGTTAASHLQFLDDLDNVIGFVLTTMDTDSPPRQSAAIVFAIALCQPHGVFRLYGIKHEREEVELNIVDVALRLAERIGDQQSHVMLLVCRGHVLGSRQRLQEALETLQRALDIAISTNQDSHARAFIKCELGNTFLQLFDYPAAEAMMRSGLIDAMESSNSISEAQLTGQLAHVLMLSGQLDESEQLYLRARHLYDENHHPLGVSACVGNLADIAMKRGNPNLAWDYGREGLFLEIEANYIDGALHTLEQLLSLCIGVDRQQFVMEQIDRVFAMLPDLQRSARQGLPESMKSRIYIDNGQYAEAKSLLLHSLNIRRRNNDPRGVAVTLGNLSLVAMRLGELEDAWNKNRQSLDAYRESGDVIGLRTCFHNGATLALDMKNIDMAIDWMCEDIKLSAQMRDLAEIAHTLHFFFEKLAPRLAVKPQLMAPKYELDFPTLMLVMAAAAGGRNLGLMIGTMNKLFMRYGAGGTPSNIPDWLKQQPLQ